MQKLYMGEMKVGVVVNQSTGDASTTLSQEFPPEELMESLAARIRPLILGSERVHYDKVLKAIEALVPAEKLEELVEPISRWRDRWVQAVDRSVTADAQAYMVITAQGTVTDRQLMYAWMYGDLVHADDTEQHVMGLSLADRYRAAAGVLARIGAVTEQTLVLVQALFDEGLLTLDSSVFDVPVSVPEPNLSVPVQAYSAPLATPVPTDMSALDPAVWRPGHIAHPAPVTSQAPSEAQSE
ncbi:hypothetical protein ACQPW1_45165 [Nocardia sp. CA-128927]|uniref:hypothetical protein n=1 Tax=Nocardia sp. CA-128927 TaxID=3239975 RepID=UPI003D96CA9C